jgi:hypothetical protein
MESDGDLGFEEAFLLFRGCCHILLIVSKLISHVKI